MDVLKIIIFYTHVTSIHVISDIGSLNLDPFSTLQSFFTPSSLKVQVPFCLGLRANCLSLKLCNLTLQDDNMNISSPAGLCSEGNTGAAIDFASPTGFPTITITPPTANGSVPVDPTGGCICNACQVSCSSNPLIGCPANSTDMPLNVTLNLSQFPSATGSFCESSSPSRQCFGVLLCNLMATAPGVSFAFPTTCLKGQAIFSFDSNNSDAPITIQLSNIEPDTFATNGTCNCDICPYLCKVNPTICPQNATSTTTMSPCTSTESTFYSSTGTSCCEKRYHH